MKNNPAKIKDIFPRDILEEINLYLDKKEILAVIGPRQSGKTTLLKIILNQISSKKKSIFITFEEKKALEIFNNDVENFKKIYVEPYDVVFIDEFQYGKDSGQKLKYLFDTSNTKFIVSGSSSLEIKNIGKYLVGRVFTFYLFPLSFLEFLKAKNSQIFKIVNFGFQITKKIISTNEKIILEDPIKSEGLKKEVLNLFFEYLTFGGYPRVVKAKTDAEKKLVLSSIVDNYLLKEIQSLLHLATENELLRLAKFLGLQIGSLISYQELSSSSGLNFIEVKKHLNILKETFILNFSFPYFKNRRLELVKNPKVYFVDFGFRNKIIENFNWPENRTDLGSLAENFVFNSLSQKFTSFKTINFWRTKSQAEVDFVIEEGEEVIPIEVKFSPLGKKVIGKSLFSFVKKYSPKKAIITTSDTFGKRQVEKTTIYFIPIFYFQP